ncbi:hypothetical protein C8J57DRAFT_1472895 [Mycena rebaudengoi]|nr:hypothetical protein C8J57DRAFT_1472895 [Mycena rebaudengoi]
MSRAPLPALSTGTPIVRLNGNPDMHLAQMREVVQHVNHASAEVEGKLSAERCVQDDRKLLDVRHTRQEGSHGGTKWAALILVAHKRTRNSVILWRTVKNEAVECFMGATSLNDESALWMKDVGTPLQWNKPRHRRFGSLRSGGKMVPVCKGAGKIGSASITRCVTPPNSGKMRTSVGFTPKWAFMHRFRTRHLSCQWPQAVPATSRTQKEQKVHTWLKSPPYGLDLDARAALATQWSQQWSCHSGKSDSTRNIFLPIGKEPGWAVFPYVYSERAEKTALARGQEWGGNQGAHLEIATVCAPPPCTGAVGLVFVVARGDVLVNLANELLSQRAKEHPYFKVRNHWQRLDEEPEEEPERNITRRSYRSGTPDDGGQRFFVRVAKGRIFSVYFKRVRTPQRTRKETSAEGDMCDSRSKGEAGNWRGKGTRLKYTTVF